LKWSREELISMKMAEPTATDVEAAEKVLMVMSSNFRSDAQNLFR